MARQQNGPEGNSDGYINLIYQVIARRYSNQMNKKKATLGLLIGLLVLVAGALTLLSTPLNDRLVLPTEAESRKIALDTTLEFARAVQAKDLSLFRSQTADEFRRQFSQEQFNRAFGDHIEQNINLFPVTKLKPVFSPSPFLTKDGTLVLKGHFPTRPSEVRFDYSYVWQNGRWKINGITLNVNPAG